MTPLKGGPSSQGEREKYAAEGERVMARNHRPRPLPESKHYLSFSVRQMRVALRHLEDALRHARSVAKRGHCENKAMTKTVTLLTQDLDKLVHRWQLAVGVLSQEKEG